MSYSWKAVSGPLTDCAHGVGDASVYEGDKRRLAMARAGSQILDSGESLPVLSMDTVAHGRISVPEWFGNGWGVFLLYRAHW
jgi:hypothetical protein